MRIRPWRVLALSLVSLSLMAIASPPPSQNIVIRIEADEWCPINCQPSTVGLGIGVDIARAIFEPLGYVIDYRIVSWTQAMNDVRSGRADAVVGASTTDDAGLVFPSSAIYTMTDDFYVLAGNPWRYQGMHTLKNRRLGIIAGYGYSQTMMNFIRDLKSSRGPVTESSGDKALQQNIELLKQGKIDIIVESKLVMDYTLRRAGSSDKLVWAGGMASNPVYIAFTPSGPRGAELKRIYESGYRNLEKTGQLQKIYSAYGIRK